MEKYKNLKKGTKMGLAVSAVLCIAILAFDIVSIPNAIKHNSLLLYFRAACDIAISIFVLFYAAIGYKKPHSNLMKGLFFAFGVYLTAITVISLSKTQQYISVGLSLLAALLIVYISGRLHKIEKNRVLLIFAGVLLLAGIIVGISVRYYDIFSVISKIQPLILHAALGFAYTARYEEHKAAGLEDK